jgi:hypothetical protein
MPDEFPRKSYGGTMTERLFSVEARYNYSSPVQFGDMILDKEWRKVHFNNVPQRPDYPGVLSRKPWPVIAENDLVHYAAAQALRWQLHAAADVEFKVGLETRLVEHEVETAWKQTAIAAREAINWRGEPVESDPAQAATPDKPKDEKTCSTSS